MQLSLVQYSLHKAFLHGNIKTVLKIFHVIADTLIIKHKFLKDRERLYNININIIQVNIHHKLHLLHRHNLKKKKLTLVGFQYTCD